MIVTSTSGLSTAGWHPAVDEFGEDFVVFASPEATILLTESFASFLAEAAARGVRPVLLTATHARVSAFVSLAMHQAGGVWAVQTADCLTFDALTGYQIGSLNDLWAPVDTTRDRLPGFTDPATASARVLFFDVYTHQRADDRAQIGLVAEAIGTTLGGQWQCWGTREPFLQTWDTSALTAAAGAMMPESQTLRGSGTGGIFTQVQVARTPTGLLEHTFVGVPLTDEDVFDTATAVLTRMVEGFSPTIACVSVAHYEYADTTVVQSARAREIEAPVAILVGPRGVRDLSLDVDALSRVHDVQQLGRAKTPCLLVRFTGKDHSLWGQAGQLAASLGKTNIMNALGVRAGKVSV